jgi:hypothetical protein
MMWMASILQVLALGAADPAPPLAAASAPAPIYWRQTLFSIPFHVDRPTSAGSEPTEIQLYVSPDRGGRWDNWRQAPPQKGYFLFKAGVDGEYWFDVRTLDRSGHLRPEGPHRPKLIVIVDTLAPKVQLTATRRADGQVAASFRIEEPYPKLDSLTIDYRTGPTASWQPVNVSPRDVRSNNSEHTGEVTWYPRDVSVSMEVRLHVGDLAGNPAEGHASVLPETSANPIRPSLGANMALPLVADARPADPFQAPASADRTPWPDHTNPAARDLAKPPATGGEAGSVSLRVGPGNTNQLVSDPRPAAPAQADRPDAANPFDGFAARPHSDENHASPAEVGPPQGVPLRWINTAVFQLTYDTRALGNTGNLPVELWGTRDGGKSWRSFGRDPKGQSPMLVTAGDDGIYGFRMVVQTGPELAGRPPMAGEAPGIWIGIDRMRPVGRITKAQQGPGRDGDKLFIEWEASDNRALAARPIVLAYSEGRGGPWHVLASGLENTGRYAWPLNPNLPPRVYLRLEIQDAAGNLGIYEAPEPVGLILSTPAAPLHDLNPLGRLNAPPGEQSWLR